MKKIINKIFLAALCSFIFVPIYSLELVTGNQKDKQSIRVELGDDKKTELSGRRWVIGLAVSTFVVLLLSIGGYFVAIDVITERVFSIKEQVGTNTAWFVEHHDKIELY